MRSQEQKPEPAQEQETPNWALMLDDIPCPRCSYNLRELTHTRCPECGLDFSWNEVIDRAKVLEQPHFEYQWRRRPFRSLVWTSVRLLVPWRFWPRCSMSGPVGVAGLLIQFAVTIVLSGSLLFGVEYLRFIGYRLIWGSGRRGFWVFYAEDVLSEIIAVLVWPLVMGLLAFLVLLLLWQTRRKYKIRKALLFRVVVYATLSLVLAKTLVSSALEITYLLASYMERVFVWRPDPDYLSYYIGFLLAFVCLFIGLKKHLRIDGAWRLASLIVFFDIVAIVFILVQAALYFGSFETFRNPVIESFTQMLPAFWQY